MRVNFFLGFLFILLSFGLLAFYWFFPFGVHEFEIHGPKHSNFSLNGTEGMQFYDNMRYPSSRISYRIDECTLQKKQDMEMAFEILSNKTILGFYPVNSEEEISVTCNSKNKIESGMFIAGEGGPVNITKTDNFNVILNGKILLIRSSECATPNIGLHELLHALGFNHSSNPNNIMYSISNCEQTLGEDVFILINKLYSYPSEPDLSFENVSAVMNGRYLDVNFSVRNNGLKKSEEAKIIIYADGSDVKEVELSSLEVGYGRAITIQNIWVKKMSVNELEFFIETSFKELEKEKNKIILKIKKN